MMRYMGSGRETLSPSFSLLKCRSSLGFGTRGYIKFCQNIKACDPQSEDRQMDGQRTLNRLRINQYNKRRVRTNLIYPNIPF